jgi:hypothetical protein
METETQYLWKASLAARQAARAGDIPAACEAIDDLEAIALHGAPKAAQGAYSALQAMEGQEDALPALYARLALGRLQAACDDARAGSATGFDRRALPQPARARLHV